MLKSARQYNDKQKNIDEFKDKVNEGGDKEIRILIVDNLDINESLNIMEEELQARIQKRPVPVPDHVASNTSNQQCAGPSNYKQVNMLNTPWEPMGKGLNTEKVLKDLEEWNDEYENRRDDSWKKEL